jgi:uncharacterized membrane protein
MATATHPRQASRTKSKKRRRPRDADESGERSSDRRSAKSGAAESSAQGLAQGKRSEQARETAARVMQAERERREPAGFSHRLADEITRFAGSMTFVAIHVVWYGSWIAWNLIPGVTFDAPPFSLLTVIVSLEAIFLALFVLISQNRQARRADERQMVDLEVNVIAEQEATKLLRLVADIHKHLGASDEHDPEIDEMLKEVDVGDLIEETARESDENGDSA